MTDPQLVSIIIPAKNEAETLPGLLDELQRILPTAAPYRFEIIVVDDHSTDATAARAAERGARVISNGRLPGKGNALVSGFEQAQGALFIMMDADYSHRPEDIPAFLRTLEDGHYGLVVGSRSTGGSDEYTLIRTLGNVGLSAVFRMLTGVQTTDVLNGYKAFRREIFDHHTYRCAQFEIEIELMINTLEEGWTIGEFACHERSRAGGEAKSRVVRHGTRFLAAIVGLSLRYQWHRLVRSDKHA
jgi:glycosyltransferase involved in cell wall biosynthesis